MQSSPAKRAAVFVLMVVSAAIAFFGTCGGVYTGIAFCADSVLRLPDQAIILVLGFGAILGLVLGWIVAKLVATRIRNAFEMQREDK